MGNAAAPSHPLPEDVSIDIINEYLLENGFSEEFIESTAEPTKRQLYKDKEIDFSLNISLGGISIDISSEESEFLFPSEDCRVQFYSFS